MELLKAVTIAILSIFEWIKIVYLMLCDYLGISEWTIIYVTIPIVVAILSINIYKAHH